MKHRQFVVLGLALSLSVAGCKKQPPPAAPPPAAPPAAQPTANTPGPVNNAQPNTPTAPTNTNAAIQRARATLEAIVYFDYNVSDIRADAQDLLRSKVSIIQANPQLRIRIEGHADERGSTEYNLALGNRRAEAIRQFMVGFGIPGDRFTILSYGEEKPRVTGTDESAWSQNRRGEFMITAGLEQLRAP